MTAPPSTAQRLVREAGTAVREALARSHLAAAWEALHERAAEDNLRGPLPYSNRALAELALAHEQFPDDAGVAHHLAIAHHARAWDLEIQGDPGAAQAWELALGYWRTVAASADF